MDSVKEIKEVVDAMASGQEYEGTDQLDRLLANQAEAVKDKTPAASLVKMMQSISKYLGARTNRAHPETLPTLAVLARNLESLVQTPAPLPDGEKEILDRSMAAFQGLKAAIASGPTLSKAEIEELKAVILSVDWEISDITLASFDRVITRLKEKLKSNKIHHTFLRIMHSIGGYIAKNKVHAHKDSVSLLRLIFHNYEEMVRQPDLAPDAKKEMVEKNIQAYNSFKRQAAQMSTSEPAPPPEGEDISPALSHVASGPSPGEPAPLSTLAEPRDLQEDPEEITPALAGKKRDEMPRDVMGELFSPKTSPADELLDAIHLAELHGPGQAEAMLDAGRDQDPEPGIKNFTPQRGNKAPIPEIESRLDEFFSLDVSDPQEGGGDALPMETAPIPEPDPESVRESDQDDGAEAIVPFQYTDESVSEEASDLATDPGESPLDRLIFILDDPAGLAREEGWTRVVEDIDQLRETWQGDDDKTVLLNLISGLCRYIQTSTGEGTGETGTPVQDLPQSCEPEPEREPPGKTGIWNKVKSLFGN